MNQNIRQEQQQNTSTDTCDGLGNVYDECGVCGGAGKQCQDGCICPNCFQRGYRGFNFDQLQQLIYEYELEENLEPALSQLKDTLEKSKRALDSPHNRMVVSQSIPLLKKFTEECMENTIESIDQIFHLPQR